MTDDETRKGTVIAIPVRESQNALAQVYYPGIVFYLFVFKIIDGHDYTSEDLTAPPVMGAWTNDAEVHRGNWTIIGTSPVRVTNFTEPEYKLLIEGRPMVESFDSKRRRPFDDGKDAGLRNRSSQSPLLVQDGVRAYFGEKNWLPFYDKFLINGAQPHLERK